MSIEGSFCDNDSHNGLVTSSPKTGAEMGLERLENQSNVFDEVDQLVELMASEKEVLTQKISKLEERGETLEQENVELRTDNINMQSKLHIQQEESSKVIKGLKEALESAKIQLEKERLKVEELTSNLDKNKVICKQQQDDKTSELKEKLRKCNADKRNIAKSLEDKCSELSSVKEQCKTLHIEKKLLETKHKELKDKLTNMESIVLAMRGRATNAKKHEERLKLKCTMLEKSLEVVSSKSPTVIRVQQSAERTREELRLMEECKKKEEAVASCTHQFQEEQKRHHLQICRLEAALQAERVQKKALSSELMRVKKEKELDGKELREKVRIYAEELKAQKIKEHEFNLGKLEVEKSLSQIGDELKRAGDEVINMRREVEDKERNWLVERQAWEHEKRKLIKEHKQQNAKLKEEEHRYRRLKESSSKRCIELAKETWRLKYLLRDLQDQQVHRPGSPP